MSLKEKFNKHKKVILGAGAVALVGTALMLHNKQKPKKQFNIKVRSGKEPVKGKEMERKKIPKETNEEDLQKELTKLYKKYKVIGNRQGEHYDQLRKQRQSEEDSIKRKYRRSSFGKRQLKRQLIKDIKFLKR